MEQNTTNTITIDEAMNEFYRLKDKYETTYYDKYVRPIVTSRLSKREKKTEFAKLPKQECINCKRNVGTIFSIIRPLDHNHIEETYRIFTVKCGDIQDPCPLEIVFKYDDRESLQKDMDMYRKSIDDIKLSIIKLKNNALFFNVDINSSEFEQLTTRLNSELNVYGLLLETNLLRNNNPEKSTLLKQTIQDFGRGYVLPFKDMIATYMDTNNVLTINQAVEFYIHDMVPKLNEIMNLKYEINNVEFDENTNIYKLIQLPTSPQDNEWVILANDKVEKNIRGEKKTTTANDTKTKIKTKTKKEKPVKEKKTKKITDKIVLEDDNDA